MTESFRDEWAWGPDVKAWFHSHLSTLYSKADHPILHVPSGRSKIGDVRIDLYTDAQVKADMFHIPYPDDSFPTILSDPPWSLTIRERAQFDKELSRVARPGALLLWSAPWMPFDGTWSFVEAVVKRTRGPYLRNARILAVLRRRS